MEFFSSLLRKQQQQQLRLKSRAKFHTFTFKKESGERGERLYNLLLIIQLLKGNFFLFNSKM